MFFTRSFMKGILMESANIKEEFSTRTIWPRRAESGLLGARGCRVVSPTQTPSNNAKSTHRKFCGERAVC